MKGQKFVWREDLGKVVPKEDAPPKPGGPTYIPDEAEFISPMDFKTVIGGRRARKEFERRHDIIQVGTDSPPAVPKERPAPLTKVWWGD